MPALKQVDLVYFNAGGGHRAAAVALELAVRRLGWPWQVRLVNLFEVLDPQNTFGRFTGMRPEDYYNKRLARGWTVGLAQELRILQGMIRIGHQALARRLQQHWLTTEPDMVVSLVPNFNRALYESLASALPGVPFVTILTDLADYPPNFWIEPNQQQHFICGSARAVEQARAAGYAAAQVHATSGMIVHPDFYLQPAVDRRCELEAMGLDPDRRTGLVMFGGQGSRAMLDISKRLPDTQLILICGHNRALAQTLSASGSSAPRLVLGFTSDVARYMAISDFFIGKPGPGSISEALVQGLPIIVVGNTWTMPQERFNLDWIRESGAGLVLTSFRSIGIAVKDLINRLDEFRTRIARSRNCAIFEIPTILSGILSGSEDCGLRENVRTGRVPSEVR